MSERTDLRQISPEALEKLRHTVLELFSQRRFHEVGIREICDRAKVSPKTIYKYFGNKDQLIIACIKSDLKLILEACESAATARNETSALEQGIAFVGEAFDQFVENRILALIVYANIPAIYWVGHPDFILHQLFKFMGRIVFVGQQKGEMWDGLPPDQLTQLTLGMIQRTILQWLASEEDVAQTLKDNLLQAVRKLVSPT